MTENKVENKLTLKPGTLALYMLGGMFPCGWVLVITGFYLMYFMTDVIALPTALAATIYSAIQWWKLVGMVASGIIIDNIKLKSGKYRGWNLIMGIVMGVAFPIAFADFGLSSGVAAAVVLIAEMVLMLGYNVYWTALRTVPVKMAKTSQDINWLNVMSNTGGTLPSLAWGFISTAILTIPLWAGTTNAYAGACTIFGVIIIICGFIMYKIAEPYDGPEDVSTVKEAKKEERIGLVTILKNLKGPMIPYFIASVAASAEAGFFSTLLTYYTTYVLKNTAIAASILMLQSLIGLVGSFLVPSLTKFITKKASHILVHALYCVCYIVMGIFGTSAAVFIGVRCFMTAVGCVSNVVSYGFPIDIGDYNEMHGLDPARGILTALGGSTVRLGFAASTTIAAFGLAAIGYSAGVDVTPLMCNKIVLLMVVGPAIFAVISTVSMLFYKVDEREIDRYRAEKAAKKALADNK